MSGEEEHEQQKRIDEQEVDKAVAVLMENFDSVQIFVNRCEGNFTRHITVGAGNFYSRYGQIVDWLQWLAKQPPDQSDR